MERKTMEKYRCIYNHEMLINFTTQTPYQSYDDPVGKAQFVGYIEELAGTQVDAVMCCPTAWRLPIYYSEVNPVWQTWGREIKDPLPEADWKYFDKVFTRVRRYMLGDGYEDPLQITADTARKHGMGFMFSYRMNDHHYTHFNGERVPPTMDPLWRDHPEWYIPTMGGIRTAMNYMVSEVRDWYYRILKELLTNYDVDGLELDLMRAAHYFLPKDVPDGLEVMTGFVASIRTMLGAFGAERKKTLKLCVRVPWTVEHCLKLGLDVPRWQEEGLLDMVNVSSHARTTVEVDMRGFRQRMPEATLYGEIHFMSGGAHGPAPGIGGARKTTREIYRTTAHSFLEQGADGISIFNFGYARDHHFHEPRLRRYTIAEPPFDILQDICDRERLKTYPRHYNLCSGFGQLPQTFPATEPRTFELYLAETSFREFTGSRLRLQFSDEGIFPDAITVAVNDVPVTMVPGSGELFQPETNEGLANPLELFFFDVPTDILQHGINTITVSVSPFAEFFMMGSKRNSLCGIELALYC